MYTCLLAFKLIHLLFLRNTYLILNISYASKNELKYETSFSTNFFELP